MKPQARRVTRRGNKHHAIGSRVDGIWFPSQAEVVRYQELCLLVLAGKIMDLKVHYRFPLRSESSRIVGFYESDFFYRQENDDQVIEDVKGQRLPLYRWKKKHFEADYARSIIEIGVKNGRSFVIPPKPTRNRRTK